MKPITAQELCKHLERAGWRLQRISGSHHIYSKTGERKVISVPVHGSKNLKPGWPGGLPETRRSHGRTRLNKPPTAPLPRAARILYMMHRDGIIGPPDGSKPREVLKRSEWLREVDDTLNKPLDSVVGYGVYTRIGWSD